MSRSCCALLFGSIFMWARRELEDLFAGLTSAARATVRGVTLSPSANEPRSLIYLFSKGWIVHTVAAPVTAVLCLHHNLVESTSGSTHSNKSSNNEQQHPKTMFRSSSLFLIATMLCGPATMTMASSQRSLHGAALIDAVTGLHHSFD